MRPTASIRLVLPLLAAVYGATSPAALPAQLSPVGFTAPVNLTTEGSQAGPAAATAAGGETLAVWWQPHNRLLARRIDADGIPVGEEIEIRPETVEVGVGFPAVAAGPDGGWTVAWAELEFLPGILSVRVRRVGASGAAAGETALVSQEPYLSTGVDPPAVAVDGSGRTAVLWRTATADGFGLSASFLEADGTPAGGVVPIAEDARTPVAAATGEGFLLAWVEAPDGEDPVARAQAVDPLGSPLGPVRRVAPAGTPPPLDLKLAGAGGGDALAVWAGRDPESELEGVWARSLDADGTGVGAPERLDLDRSRRNLLADLTALPGVGYLAAWQGPAGGPGGLTGFGLVGRFLAAGPGPGRGPQGPELELVPASDDAVFDAALAGGPGLAATAVWSTCIPQGFVQPGSPPCAGGGDLDGVGLVTRRFEGPAGGALQLVPGPRVLGEGAGFATVTVERVGSTDGLVTVNVATVDLPGGANAGLDFDGRFETLVWPDGDGNPKRLEIPILEDALPEGDERFRVALNVPTGGAGLGEPSEAVLTLLDNDAVGATVDDPALADLAPAESSCDGERLAAFFERLALEAPASARPVGVSLSLTASGDFSGIATTANGPATPEHHLAFSTNPEGTPLLLNPARPQLVTVGLTRNRLASDLVGSTQEGADPDRLTLILNPTLEPDPPPAALLRVDNLAGPAGRPADAKPGRGLLALAEPCHGRLGRADVHVLRVLQKVVRAETPGATRQSIALYPGAEPGSYRIDVYPRDASGAALGRLAAEVTVELTGSTTGARVLLTTGELRVLPPCGAAGETGCTDLDRETTLHLVRPLFQGFWTPTPYRVTVGPGGPEAPLPAVQVDWGDLLGASTWLAVF